MKIVEACVQRRNTFEIGFKKVTAIAKKRIGIEPVQAAQEQMIRVHKVVTDCWKIAWSKRKNLDSMLNNLSAFQTGQCLTCLIQML